MKPTLLLTALICALALALGACGGDDGGEGGGDGGGRGADGRGGGAQSAERPVIGIGEQGAAMFKDERFTQLGIKKARLVTAYDAARVGFERDLVTLWVSEARRTGIEPFITFGHSRVHPKKLPSVREYRRDFRAFRRRFPDVQVFAPWNEINHPNEPTSRSPRRAAEYYNAMKAECPTCTVLAGDVLDQEGMVRYLREYQRHLDGEPAIWGLHNYADANRFRSRGLDDMLTAVKGEIWLTETGGIVKFGRSFPRDEQRAARAVRYAIKLARDNERVARIYLYNWTGADRGARFDSGLVDSGLDERPALDVLREELEQQ
ncbi:MAG TPA: glycosyl hydrolase [Solirubrobacteraceae bacterium]|nr:glycosyl hydrolase [Solirubrobacteraceae bacterium]